MEHQTGRPLIAGGLVEFAFDCPKCGTRNEGECEIPSPILAAEKASDSETEDDYWFSCPKCETEYRCETYSSLYNADIIIQGAPDDTEINITEYNDRDREAEDDPNYSGVKDEAIDRSGAGNGDGTGDGSGRGSGAGNGDGTGDGGAFDRSFGQDFSLVDGDRTPEKTVLFVKTGWCDYYDGRAGDEPKGDALFLQENVGHEFYNFKNLNGKLFGYFEPPGGNRVNAERVQPGAPKTKLADCLIIMLAPNPAPDKTGLWVVGWYEGATLYWERQAGSEERGGYSYLIEAEAENSVLLKLEDRWKLEGIEFSQRHAIYYPYDDNGQFRYPADDPNSWYCKALDFVTNFEGADLIERPEELKKSDVWMIRGLGGSLYQAFYHEQAALIGWPLGKDPALAKKYNELRTWVERKYQDGKTSKRAITLWTSFLWNFSRVLKPGTRVITVNDGSNGYRYRIGEVEENYRFDPVSAGDFPHRLSVHWRSKEIKREDLSAEAQATLRTPITLFLVKPAIWKELEKLAPPEKKPNPEMPPGPLLPDQVRSDAEFGMGASNSDALGAAELAAKFAKLLPQVSAPAVLGLFGQWGRGKTFFYKELCKEFQRLYDHRFHWMHFNAWLYQDTPATWAYLHGEILKEYLLLRGESPYAEPVVGKTSLRKWFRRQIRRIYFNFKWKNAPKLLGWFTLTIALVGALWLGGMPLAEKVIGKEDAAKGLGALLTGSAAVVWLCFLNYIDLSKKRLSVLWKLKRYDQALGLQAEIQEDLAELLKKWFPKGSSKKLFLFIDDLDRCDEKKIVTLIDAIRVMMEHPDIQDRIVVLVAVDERILSQAVEIKYHDFFTDPGKSKPLVVHMPQLRNKQNPAAPQSPAEPDNPLSPMVLAREYLDKLFLFGIKLRPNTPKERTALSDLFLLESRLNDFDTYHRAAEALLVRLQVIFDWVKEQTTTINDIEWDEEHRAFFKRARSQEQAEFDSFCQSTQTTGHFWIPDLFREIQINPSGVEKIALSFSKTDLAIKTVERHLAEAKNLLQEIQTVGQRAGEMGLLKDDRLFWVDTAQTKALHVVQSADRLLGYWEAAKELAIDPNSNMPKGPTPSGQTETEPIATRTEPLVAGKALQGNKEATTSGSSSPTSNASSTKSAESKTHLGAPSFEAPQNAPWLLPAVELPVRFHSLEEVTELEKAYENLGRVTPRQMKSFYFKYLFGRSLLKDEANRAQFSNLLAFACNPGLRPFAEHWLLHDSPSKLEAFLSNGQDGDTCFETLKTTWETLKQNQEQRDQVKEILHMLVAY